jgi:hypothetical protein
MQFRISAGVRRGIACAGLTLAACAGGGGGDETPPAITVTFAAAGAGVNEGAAALTVTVMLHTLLAQTDQDVSVTVSDMLTGTAAGGSDYTSFAPQVVTFPAGSVEGDTRTVALTALNDMLVEGSSETVRLGLSGASGATVAGIPTYTATITDVNQADVLFAAGATATVAESAGTVGVLLVLDLPAGVTLGVPASVRVSDLGTGTGTSGSDYTAFAAQTVTFAAGSADGATRTVNVVVIDDATVELDETVRLGLSLPAAGTQIGATSTKQLTVTDNDSSGPSGFLATQGATGVENTLADNQLVDLGTQTVAAGPNAGTLVRVTNVGGAPLQIDAPFLTGTNPNDFDVTIESAPLVAPADVRTAGDPALDAMSPLAPMPSGPGAGIALAFDAQGLAALASLGRTTLYGFPLPDRGEVTLQLQRMPIPVADDAILRVDGIEIAGGMKPLVEGLSIWTGNVLEVPGSRVFLALTHDGPQGFVELPGAVDELVHLTRGQSGELRAASTDELAAMGLEPPPFACEDAPEVPASSRTTPAPPAGGMPALGEMTAAECRVAMETDWQLYQKFNSTPALTNYVTQLIAAVSAQYFEDVQTTLSIAYLGIHTSAADPWTAQDSGGDAGDVLDEFRNAWATGGWPATANLAHFISGAGLGGGIAYVNVICNQSFGFGVSGNINGNINWGTWSGQAASFTWDFVVVAHELGHNFGSSHTHSYCPPLDQCSTNCTGPVVCSQGTIMSYCHTCGGMDNIDLHFHPVTANIMRGAVNASCLGASALLSGDYVQYRVRFNPLTATGQRDATMQFVHDSASAPTPFRVRLRGQAQ